MGKIGVSLCKFKKYQKKNSMNSSKYSLGYIQKKLVVAFQKFKSLHLGKF
jgi:hypothetical protein